MPPFPPPPSADNDAFDFGELHTSKPKDQHHHHKNGGEKKGHGKNKNKGRRNNKNNNNNNNSNKKFKNPFEDDDFFSSATSSHSSNAPNSHSYSGISMPSYTHEFSVSNSDQKEVFFNPSPVAPSNSGHSGHNHNHQYHYESQPFKYPNFEQDTEYVGHASSSSPDFSQFNWSPSIGDFGSSSSAFNLPTSSLTGAETAQSPIGPVFRPPRKSAPKPFHGKKGSHGAPRAGPRRPPRNNQGESFLRGPASGVGSSLTSGKMAGHQHHTHRPHALLGSASNHQIQNNKGHVHKSRPRPVMAAAATETLETVMLPPATTQE